MSASAPRTMEGPTRLRADAKSAGVMGRTGTAGQSVSEEGGQRMSMFQTSLGILVLHTAQMVAGTDRRNTAAPSTSVVPTSLPSHAETADGVAMTQWG